MDTPKLYASLLYVSCVYTVSCYIMSPNPQPRIILSMQNRSVIVPYRKSFTSHCLNFDQLEDCFSSSSCFYNTHLCTPAHSHIYIQFLFVFFYTILNPPHSRNHLCFSFYGSNNAQRRYLICIYLVGHIHNTYNH